MGRLIYTALGSLDGRVADLAGNFDWAAPDAEVHAFVNDRERLVATYLLGRRMHEVMSYWDSAPTDDPEDIGHDYARVWQAADKIVYSRTLDAVVGERTRLEREFTRAGVEQLKASSDHDLSVGGADLAAQALRLGLVDEVRLYLSPVVVGAGPAALPSGIRLDLTLREHRRFTGGVVFLRYDVTPPSGAAPVEG